MIYRGKNRVKSRCDPQAYFGCSKAVRLTLRKSHLCSNSRLPPPLFSTNINQLSSIARSAKITGDYPTIWGL